MHVPGSFSVFQFIVLVLQPATLLLVQSHMSHQSRFLTQQPAVCSKKGSDTTTVYYLPITKQQTEKASDSLVNIVDYLEAKETDFSPRSW